MVLLLDGNSETDAHVRSASNYLISLSHSSRSRADTNLSEKYRFPYPCARCFDLQSNISTVAPPVIYVSTEDISLFL